MVVRWVLQIPAVSSRLDVQTAQPEHAEILDWSVPCISLYVLLLIADAAM